MSATVGAEGFDDDAGDYRPPPPIDDRLWRHPAEVGHLVGATGAAAPPPRAALAARRSLRRSPIAVGFVSVVGGAVLAGSLMFTAGGLGDEPRRIGLAPFATLVPSSGADTGIVSVTAAANDTERNATALVLDDGVHVVTSAQVVAGVPATTASLPGPDAATPIPSTAAGMALGRSPASTTNATSPRHAALRIVDEQGVVHAGDVVALDPANDLAIIRVDGTRLTPFDPHETLARAGTGELALLGGGYGAGQRRWRAEIAEHDAAYHGDNVDHVGVSVLADPLPAAAAGAVAIDDAGRVVGVVSVDLRTTGAAATRLAAVVVPATRVWRTTEQFLTTGTVSHAWLGVEASPVLDNAVQMTRQRGAAVDHVVPDSPAGTAGVRAGDVITRVCGTRVGTIDDIVARLLEIAPGTVCDVELLRDGNPVRAELVLGSRAA